jgi:hypothetical protein
MPMESENCRRLRSLIAVDVPDNTWKEQSAICLGFDPYIYEIMSSNGFATLWKPEWGTITAGVAEDKPALIWTRPDGGPMLIDNSEVDPKIKVFRFMLQMRLIEELQALSLLSFVKPGVPAKWRWSKVYADGEELEQVMWADALVGQAEIVKRKGGEIYDKATGELHTFILSGAIIIALGDKDLGFL